MFLLVFRMGRIQIWISSQPERSCQKVSDLAVLFAVVANKEYIEENNDESFNGTIYYTVHYNKYHADGIGKTFIIIRTGY